MTRSECHVIKSSFLKRTIDILNIITEHEDFSFHYSAKDLKIGSKNRKCFFPPVLIPIQECNKYHDPLIQNLYFEP